MLRSGTVTAYKRNTRSQSVMEEVAVALSVVLTFFKVEQGFRTVSTNNTNKHHISLSPYYSSQSSQEMVKCGECSKVQCAGDL